MKVMLKLKRPHQTGFRLGRHIITSVMKEYELNDKEVAELKTKGPQAWIKEVSAKDLKAAPKSNQENKAIQSKKKADKKKEEKES